MQNVHYGEREELPFDLKHKAGPIQYRLPPGATKQAITAERARLRDSLVEALRPYLSHDNAAGALAPQFDETARTVNPAFFWQPSEILARFGSQVPALFRRRSEDNDAIEYRFDEPRAFYLRLIPTIPQAEALRVTRLTEMVESRRVQVLTRNINAVSPGRNRYGAISYEAHRTSTVPNAFTQLFRNGEIWGVSREFAASYKNAFVVPMMNVQNIYKRVLANFISISSDDLRIAPPYQVEMGAIGLKDMQVSLPAPVNPWDDISEPIYEDELAVRRVLNSTASESQQALVDEFLEKLYDLAGVTTR